MFKHEKIFLVCCLCTLAFTLFGCAKQDEDKTNLAEMNAQEILEALNSQGYPNDAASYYMDKGSTSGYPWSIKGCTSAVNFTIKIGNQGEESGGIIEVFDNTANSKMRKDAAAVLSSFASPDQDYFVQVGVVFMQIPFALTAYEASQFEAALKALERGEAPDTFVAETKNLRSLWGGYSKTFPEYIYKDKNEISLADRHFALQDEPQNQAEELVARHFYYDISGAYEKLYDLCGSESLKISATNTERNFKDGSYVEEYIVKSLSTMSFDAFVNMDSSMLDLMKRDIEKNQLIAYTLVKAEFAMKAAPGLEGQAQLSDGDHTFCFLCGKTQLDDEYKLYEVYWE